MTRIYIGKGFKTVVQQHDFEKSVTKVQYIDGGTNIIIEKSVLRKLDSNARVRKKPGIHPEYFKLKRYEPDYKEYPYLPKNREIKIIGRSDNKDKIDDMNDYWYYCHTWTSWYPELPQRGWKYGGLINK